MSTALRRYSAEEVAHAITQSKGLISIAAKSLGCSAQNVRNHVKRSPLVADALREARESTLDVAELALYNQVLAGEGWAVCFILKTLGKSRGFVERQELSGPDGGAIPIVALREALRDAYPDR